MRHLKKLLAAEKPFNLPIISENRKIKTKNSSNSPDFTPPPPPNTACMMFDRKLNFIREFPAAEKILNLTKINIYYEK